MRIIHVLAGAGVMYCGPCIRDLTVMRGLLARGHDVEIIPMYTPLRSDRSEPPTARLFYGGILCYLEQLCPCFRHMPGFIERLLDSRWLLNAVSGFALSTQPSQLGPMTVSVLAGREGRQARELHRMVSYLKSQERPAVLSISNMLLSGVAPELRRELGVPLVSGFLGEDSFLDALAEPYRREAHEQLRKNAAAVDLFLAPGEACAEKMTKYLGIPRHKVKVIRIGVDVDVYPAAAARPRTPFTVGYLSVLTPQKGLDVLVEAFRRLAVDERRDVRLRVGGRVLDRGYWRAIQRTVTRAGLQSRFEHLGEVDLAGKVALMQNCSAFALPSRIEEAKGLAVMEAMACGAPALAPGSGVFPELFARTGGGVCFDPDDPGTLARELARLMDDPEAADEMGRAAAAGIRKDYSAARMVEEVEAEFTGLARSQG